MPEMLTTFAIGWATRRGPSCSSGTRKTISTTLTMRNGRLMVRQSQNSVVQTISISCRFTRRGVEGVAQTHHGIGQHGVHVAVEAHPGESVHVRLVREPPVGAIQSGRGSLSGSSFVV